MESEMSTIVIISNINYNNLLDNYALPNLS
jgi:hypothetical protein